MIPQATEKAVAALPEKSATDLSRRPVAAVDAFSTHLQEARSDRKTVSKVAPNRNLSHRESVRSKPQESSKSRAPAAPGSCDCAEEMPVSAELSPQESQASDVDVVADTEGAPSERDGTQTDSNSPSVVHIFPIEAPVEKVVTDATDEVATTSPTSQIDAPLAPVNDVLPDSPPSNVASQNPAPSEVLAQSGDEAAILASNNGKIDSPQPESEVSVNSNEPATASRQAKTQWEVPDAVSETAQPSVKSSSQKSLDVTENSQSLAATVSSVQIQKQLSSQELNSGPEEQTPQLENAPITSPASGSSNSKQIKPSGVVTFARYLVGEPKSPQGLIEPIGASLAPVEFDTSAGAIDPTTTTEEEKASRQDPVTRADANPILSPADAVQVAASTLPPTLRRHMEAHNVGPAPASMGTPISDSQQARLMQRVAKAFRAAEDKGGEVQIRLSPPELGSMKLELSLTSGVLTAKLEVENQRAQTILLDSLPQLRDRLAEQGIRVEKFDVNLQQRDTGGQQSQHQQSSSERHARSASTSSRLPVESKSNESHMPTRAAIDASRLNVMV